MMNKSYKIIWNESLQDWVVTGEFACGKKKTKTLHASKAWQASLLLAGSISASGALAADQVISTFTPSDNTIVISGNDNLVQADGKGFAEWLGNDPGFKKITIRDAFEQGIITDGAEYLDDYNIQTGTQNATTTILDAATGKATTVNVYDNDSIIQTSLDDFVIPTNYDVGADGQFVDKFIYSVSPGASLNVAVGDTSSDWVNNPANFVNVILKSSSPLSGTTNITSAAFNIEDSGTLNYESKTIVSLGNADSIGVTNAHTLASFQTVIGSTVDSKIGSFSVTNLDELKAYNTALIEAIHENKLAYADYESEFRKALKPDKFIGNDPVTQNDPVTMIVNSKQVAYLYAHGQNATINVSDDANIQLFQSNASLARVEDGAVLNNAGNIGSFYNTLNNGSTVVSADSAKVHNTLSGVIDAGTSQEIDTFAYGNISASNFDIGSYTAIDARNTDVINDGVINLASPQSYANQKGIYAKEGSKVINNGAINIASTDQTANVLGTNVKSTGVSLSGEQTSMINNGTISIGRSAQRSLADQSNDVEVNWAGIRGITVGTGSEFVNTGDIITGAQTHGVTALAAFANGTAINEGNIILNSAYSPDGKIPVQSVGIDANALATEVDNKGTILLNGINSVGLNVTHDAQAKNSGKIIVANGVDTNSNTPNFGIQSQGNNAKAILTGSVNLTGNDAIGVYVKDKGAVEVNGGNVNFQSGENQVGYLIHGIGSSVTNTSTSQSVDTKGSTLYRISGGARFDSAGENLTASAVDSTLLLATDAGSKIDTTGMTLNASGDNATAVKVEGGAYAKIDATTLISLTGKDSVAGSVQGASSTIYGEMGETGESVLDSSAVLNSEGNVASGAMGYIVSQGGTLNHNGLINITAPGSTGVEINGGTLNNSTDISVNGTAVDIIGAQSVINNTGEIVATDGKAAYRLSKGASLELTGSGTTLAKGSAHGILLDTGAAGLSVQDGTINMDAAGTGNGIENIAEIDGIQLTDTTINVGNGAGVRTSATLAKTNSGTLNVNGSGTGLLFQNADGTMSDKAYDMSDSQQLVININSADGKGMTTNTSGDIKTGVSINVADSAGGAALVIGGETANVSQSGSLISNAATQVVDIDNGFTHAFSNTGTISSMTQNAQVMNVEKQGVDFTNAASGMLTGAVNLLSSEGNKVTLEHGSKANTIFTTGNGDDTFILNNIVATENATLFTELNGGEGHDRLELNNSVYAVRYAQQIQNIENINLSNKSLLTLDNALIDLSEDEQGYSIDQSSTLIVKNNGALDFASHLAGNGLIQVDLGSKDNNFAFTDNNKADKFAGTVELTNSHFKLDGDSTVNNQALSDATLSLGNGSVTDVAKGTQQIGGLAFNGGTAVFDTDSIGKSVSDAYVTTTGKLDLGGEGFVQLGTSNPVFNGPVMPENTVNLLAQDDGEIALKLADSSTDDVSNFGGNITLLDRDGKVVSDSVSSTVEQNGETVANVAYDYRLTSGANSDGLYVNYGLTDVELLTSGENALRLNAGGATAASADLSASISGKGDFIIDAGMGNTISLSHQDNTYTGKTEVDTGTLLAENNNVLGQTSELHQSADTTFNVNGYSQTVGMLNTDVGAKTHLNGGSLILTNGGYVNGSLSGEGALTVNADTLTVNGENSDLNATSTIESRAIVNLNHILGLGQGAIIDNGLLKLNEGVQGILANTITGTGGLVKNGAGLVDMTADAAQYSGTTIINEGALQLGNIDNEVMLASSSVEVAEGAQFGGFGGTAGDVDNKGILTIGEIATVPMTLRATTGTHGQNFTVGNNLKNSGTINVSAPGSSTAGNILHVSGNYEGNNGTLNLNTVLGGDNSLTDKLIVDGNTSGSTQVVINNAGGTGAKTLNGIEVVSVGGDSTGQFSKKGRIVAGAYDYDLVKNGKNWYLTNNGDVPTPDGGGDTPINPVDPVKPDNGGDKPAAPDIRPEGKAYASNMMAANTLFNMTLHDRLGETHYVDALGQDQVTSLWLRQVGGHNRSNDGSGQNKTQANRYVAQLGGDIAQWSSNGDDRFHIGIMGGYANQSSDTRNHKTGYSAKGSVDGYSTGIYGTWFQDNKEKTGAYVDSWVMYNWFDNSVSAKGASSESYKSKGFTASVETGYTWKLGEKNDHESYYVQPQAQVTWMGVKADDLKEANGTNVQFGGDDNVQTRLGARAFIKGHNGKLDAGKQRTFEPFVEANWIHNTKDFTAGMDGVPVKVAGTRNIGELKAGVEAKLNNNVNMWGNVAQQIGDKGYSDTQAMIGIKVNFK